VKFTIWGGSKFALNGGKMKLFVLNLMLLTCLSSFAHSMYGVYSFDHFLTRLDLQPMRGYNPEDCPKKIEVQEDQVYLTGNTFSGNEEANKLFIPEASFLNESTSLIFQISTLGFRVNRNANSVQMIVYPVGNVSSKAELLRCQYTQ
jgi:hypothetical protein